MIRPCYGEENGRNQEIARRAATFAAWMAHQREIIQVIEFLARLVGEVV